MVKEVGELELGDRLPEGKLRELKSVKMIGRVPCLPLYRV
jgi:hypothetical protein